MNDKKFLIPGIVVSAIALALSIFGFSVEALVLSIVSLIINLRKRQEFRIKIPVVLIAAGVFPAVTEIIFMIWVGTSGSGSTGYWLFDLIF